MKRIHSIEIDGIFEITTNTKYKYSKIDRNRNLFRFFFFFWFLPPKQRIIVQESPIYICNGVCGNQQRKIAKGRILSVSSCVCVCVGKTSVNKFHSQTKSKKKCSYMARLSFCLNKSNEPNYRCICCAVLCVWIEIEEFPSIYSGVIRHSLHLAYTHTHTHDDERRQLAATATHTLFNTNISARHRTDNSVAATTHHQARQSYTTMIENRCFAKNLIV